VLFDGGVGAVKLTGGAQVVWLNDGTVKFQTGGVGVVKFQTGGAQVVWLDDGTVKFQIGGAQVVWLNDGTVKFHTGGAQVVWLNDGTVKLDGGDGVVKFLESSLWNILFRSTAFGCTNANEMKSTRAQINLIILIAERFSFN
jgi:hypothetical protein